MIKKYLSAILKKQGDKITFVASDETLDRVGDVLKIEDWDLSHYKANPVLLVNHEYRVENIVGAAKSLRIEDKKLLFEPVHHMITEKSREVDEMVRGEWLNTVSVGYMDHAPMKEGERPRRELFEISYVPVPANPSAERLRAIIAKSVDKAEEIDQVKVWMEKQRETTEVQTIICSKEKFKTQEEAATWCKEHDFKADKADETENSYRFRQFEPSACQDDTERTIDITEGVQAVICKPKKAIDSTETKAQIDPATAETLALLTKAVADLTRQVEALVKAKAEKPTHDAKGRDPKEEPGRAHKLPPAVVRALQAINRETNDLLRKLK